MSWSVNTTEIRVAVFIDFENIKRAVDEYFSNERVDLTRILDEIARTTRGRILLKRAYADWGAFKDYRSDLLDNATEPVQAFSLTQKGKNGTDIRITIDVMELVLRQPDITHVALVSGDSDFTPLVMKLREFGRHVIGVGVRSNTSTYLARSCDQFLYYDEMRMDGDGLSLRQQVISSDPVRLLIAALAALGNRPVPGSALKTQMRKLDPLFDETRLGHTSFLEFLRTHTDTVDIFKPPVGDVTVALRGQLGEASTEPASVGGYPTYQPASYAAAAAPLTLAERYRYFLRDNNFRYVPYKDRQQIIEVLCQVFENAPEEGISLKEAKDQLHGWFEEYRPAVPWDSINSTVYHLFYTWCFSFDRTDEGDGKQLWDRRTTLQSDIVTAEDVLNKCERGVVRKIWERERNEIDDEALNEWLYDGDPEMLPRVRELIDYVAAPGYTTTGRAM